MPPSEPGIQFHSGRGSERATREPPGMRTRHAGVSGNLILLFHFTFHSPVEAKMGRDPQGSVKILSYSAPPKSSLGCVLGSVAKNTSDLSDLLTETPSRVKRLVFV